MKCWVSRFKLTLHEQLNSLLQRLRFSHVAPSLHFPDVLKKKKKLTALSLNLNSYSLAFYWADLEGTASLTALLNRTAHSNVHLHFVSDYSTHNEFEYNNLFSSNITDIKYPFHSRNY